MSHSGTDCAQVVRIDALTPEHVSRKLRVVGRVRLYDAENALVCVADEQDTLLVDVSLCLSGYRPLAWLHEINTPIMAIGYLEKLELKPYDDDDALQTLILRALLVKDQRALNIDVWNKALDAINDSGSIG
ncbi:hypothetical protein PsYK624_129340 [Phanerochaete sordida]|uniref:Uncharacterized protein n=1 Tax=Phanerochaete sordida TaxID=48140 RepID=A0A9P3GKS2_9APHY|nr:hypothetical protein PsYK624_129340 [Phanerochaete sordida]